MRIKVDTRDTLSCMQSPLLSTTSSSLGLRLLIRERWLETDKMHCPGKHRWIDDGLNRMDRGWGALNHFCLVSFPLSIIIFLGYRWGMTFSGRLVDWNHKADRPVVEGRGQFIPFVFTGFLFHAIKIQNFLPCKGLAMTVIQSDHHPSMECDSLLGTDFRMHPKTTFA